MIAVLAGGVGAARLLEGLVEVVDPREITVIVNTGDDTTMHGLYIAPDLDTITYTLAGASNRETGWGLAGETWTTIEALERFGTPTWFRLGDRDLATHIYRTNRLNDGATLAEVTTEIARAWGLALRLVPMSNDAVRTRIELASGPEVEFQEYFVHLRHDVEVRAVRYHGAEMAAPAPGVLDALADAEVILLAPSNPILSLAPIFSIKEIADLVQARRDDVVAISPIVGGAALKGPADRLLVELGGEASPAGVARVLAPFIGTLIFDRIDAGDAEHVRAYGVRPVLADTVMATPAIARSLAEVALERARPASAR